MLQRFIRFITDECKRTGYRKKFSIRTANKQPVTWGVCGCFLLQGQPGYKHCRSPPAPIQISTQKFELEDKVMSKKYYCKVAGYFYEVSEEFYINYRREINRRNYLKRQKEEKNITVFSYDALGDERTIKGNELIVTDMEEKAIQNILIEKLRMGLRNLSADELFLIEQLIFRGKSEREMAEVLSLSQVAVHKRKKKIFSKLKKFLEN